MARRESKWEIKEQPDNKIVDQLSAELGIDRVLAELLATRGVESYEQARAFFRPSLDQLHDPFLMKDMDLAVERLHKAIESKEKVLVYGDYDVDGTTAVALVYSFVRRFTKELEFYIPDRYDEGYGVSYKGIDWAAEHGCGLIITLDCGIKAIEKTEYARQKGIDVIICDHHLPENSLPRAVAVLDPKREDDNYPFDDLSGCGVGFKFVQAYSQKYGIEFESLIPLLDLLAVSIAADLVTMVGENRILSHFGLKVLNESPRYGLLAMIELSKLEQGHISMDDIVFKIGPRINAAGRMESGRLAVQLLTATNESEAMELGEAINENNTERKNIDREITQEALEMVETGSCLACENATIVYNPEWNKGVVGIVASRLVEAFYKPTIVLTRSNGFVTGSARSIVGFDLYEAIESCSDLLENFGGHTYAAGLSLREENLEAFTQRFLEQTARDIGPEQMMPQIDIDAVIDLSEVNMPLLQELKRMEPFGPGNDKPVFATMRVHDYGTSRRVGRDLEHLRLEVVDSRGGGPLHGIAFGMSEHSNYVKQQNPFDICYSVEENTYNDNTTLQLMVKDIRPSVPPLSNG